MQQQQQKIAQMNIQAKDAETDKKYEHETQLAQLRSDTELRKAIIQA